MTYVECAKCGKKFAYELTGAVYPGGKDLETADCPYCGEVATSQMTSGFFHSYKLDSNGNITYKE
jgi:uncharacterized protein CbrC (UPF0167 family)